MYRRGVRVASGSYRGFDKGRECVEDRGFTIRVRILPSEYGFAALRVIEKDGEPWFVAREVAELLGYKDTDKAIRTHCKAAKLFNPAEMAGLTSSPYGMTCIPERDIYRLVLKSKLPAAERFEEWVVTQLQSWMMMKKMASVLPTP